MQRTRPLAACAVLVWSTTGCVATSGDHETHNQNANSTKDGRDSGTVGLPSPATSSAALEASAPNIGISLCDGSHELRFLATEQQNSGDFEHYSGWGYLYSWFLAIDGRCNYWVMGQPGAYGVRQGTLDPDSATDVATKLLLDSWDSLYPKSVPGVVDQGVTTLAWEGKPVTCPLAGCGDAQVDALLGAAVGLRDDLGMDASEATAVGVLSLRLLDADGNSSVVAPPTLSSLIDDQYDQLPSDGAFRLLEISDSESLAWLRQQRDAFLESSFPSNLELLLKTSAGTSYAVAYRDRVPLAEPDGWFR